MLTHLKISGFRGFRELQVDGLTRVNLFVGTNNVGKTSILEAAEMAALGKTAGLLSGPRRRGESFWVEIPQREGAALERRVLDLSHLFYGHALNRGHFFEISGGSEHWLRCVVSETEAEGSQPRSGIDEPVPVLLVSSSASEGVRQISPILQEHWITAESFLPGSLNSVHFLGAQPIPISQLSQLWDEVVLTPEEEGVVAAIQIIEPTIERIAFLGERNTRSIFLKLAGMEERLPLWSMGEGLRRLLVLALHLIPSVGGYLMIDEIDTGLHHTVMVDMWKLVIETARRLGVQVLATTHSLDCVRALAWVQEKNPEMASEVTLHRIERGLTQTIRYTMDELAIAAEHHLEVR